MTFEEWYNEVGVEWQQHKNVAQRAWDSRVPEGYVLVPVEPTEAMVEAGLVADTECPFVDDVYKAMIAAAQKEK